MSCQAYERELNATLSDFSTETAEQITTLNGKIELLNASVNLVRVDDVISDSDFTVTIQQGNSVEDYKFKNYTLIIRNNLATDVSEYDFSGDISSSALLGRVSVFVRTLLLRFGSEDLPYQGVLVTEGQGAEKIDATISDSDLTLKVDSDDENGGLSIQTTWSELIERDFKETE